MKNSFSFDFAYSAEFIFGKDCFYFFKLLCLKLLLNSLLLINHHYFELTFCSHYFLITNLTFSIFFEIEILSFANLFHSLHSIEFN